jgi:hypothetical protein
MSADSPRRSAVVPADPATGISCFANDAPIWNEIIATIALESAAVSEEEDEDSV